MRAWLSACSLIERLPANRTVAGLWARCPDFELTAETGKPFTRQDLSGHSLGGGFHLHHLHGSLSR